MKGINENLTDHYNDMYKHAIEKIASGKYDIDELIDSKNDHRFGLTLVVRPSSFVKEKIQGFIDQVRTVDSVQYFYSSSDLHITVLSIVSCYGGFDINRLNILEYIDLIKSCIRDIVKFEVSFQGITASPGAIMIAGQLSDDSLNVLRNNLRKAFKASSLFHTIDKRYPIFTAHSTVVRFRDRIKDRSMLLKVMADYEDYNFGSFTVDSLELVYNDWYQRSRNVKHLYRFSLNEI